MSRKRRNRDPQSTATRGVTGKGKMRFRIDYQRKYNEVACRVDGIGVSAKYANKPIEVFGDQRPKNIPADIFNDFCAAFESGRPVGDTILWKAIRPDVPAKYANSWGFWIIIHGNGIAPNYLAKVQDPGPYRTRFPSDLEERFQIVFRWAVRAKWENTYFPGRNAEEIEEMRRVVMKPASEQS